MTKKMTLVYKNGYTSIKLLADEVSNVLCPGLTIGISEYSDQYSGKYLYEIREETREELTFTDGFCYWYESDFYKIKSIKIKLEGGAVKALLTLTPSDPISVNPVVRVKNNIDDVVEITPIIMGKPRRR